MTIHGSLPSAAQFLGVLDAYAASFPYSTGCRPVPDRVATSLVTPGDFSLVRFLPLKANWSLEELIGFEGEEFAFAATRSLQQRAPTPAETHRFTGGHNQSAKLEFLLQLEHANRRARTGGRMLGLRGSRSLWRAHRALAKAGVKPLSKLAHSLFRARARRDTNRATQAANFRQLFYLCMDRIDRAADGSRWQE